MINIVKRKKNIAKVDEPTISLNDMYMKEICALTDFFTSYSDSKLNDISLVDLYGYFQNPYNNLEKIRNASKYFSFKHGVLRDINNLFKYLPTLNYHLSWSSFDDIDKIKEYEKIIYDFLESINIKQVIRDGLYEVCELGTVVLCLRKKGKNIYIQFMDLDDVVINKTRNGKWIVEFDLETIRNNRTLASNANATKNIIENLPEDITIAKYNKYLKDNAFRYVELKNCEVVSINSTRNFPYGFPLCMGAWTSIIQKEVINRAERSVSNRLIKQLLILTVGTIGGSNTKEGTPVPKEITTYYFNSIKDLLLKAETGTDTNSVNNASGVGVATMPDFFKLDSIKTDASFFPKEVYDKIDKDIFMNLGISPALIYGGSENSYSSAQLNNEKLFRYINSILEQFELIITNYIRQEFLPEDLDCVFYFDKSNFINKKENIKQYKELYTQTGIVIPWIETLTENPYHYTIGMKKYQDEVLKLDKLLVPPINPHTQSVNDGGRPSSDNPTNANTEKSKGNDSNNIPSPSD